MGDKEVKTKKVNYSFKQFGQEQGSVGVQVREKYEIENVIFSMTVMCAD